MRRLLTILIIGTAATQLLAQKINREPNDPRQIIHLKTALNHLTVIELREPVLQVAAGSQSFKVEWRENKVFVQPTEPDASTNLFVWTSSQRLNYELEPAGSVAVMDFAVDQELPPQPKPTSVKPQEPSPTEVLLSGQPVRLESAKPSTRSVEVRIRDLYEKDGRLLVRYAVRNNSAHAYEVTTPSVYVLPGVRYPQSLYGLVDSQLGDREASRLDIKKQSPVAVIEGHVQSSHLQPGQQCLGLVALRIPPSKEPMVLRFQFANDDREQVSGFSGALDDAGTGIGRRDAHNASALFAWPRRLGLLKGNRRSHPRTAEPVRNGVVPKTATLVCAPPAGSLRFGRGLRLFQFVALRTSEGDHPCRPSGTIIPQCSKAPRLSSALHSCFSAGLRGMSRVNAIT